MLATDLLCAETADFDPEIPRFSYINFWFQLMSICEGNFHLMLDLIALFLQSDANVVMTIITMHILYYADYSWILSNPGAYLFEIGKCRG